MTEWKNTKLSEVAIKTDYGYTASACTDEVGPKFLRITDIVPYYVNYDTVPYCVISDKHFQQYKVEKGDLLVARTGATTGYNYLFNDDINAVFASYLIRFRFDKTKAKPLYMKYIMKSSAYKGFIYNSVGGSAQPGINAKVLGRFNFNIPDLETQDRIASVLSAYDDLIEKNNSKIQILQDMAEELYKEWFVRFRFPGYKTAKFTDGIPDGWKVKKANEIFDITIGRTPSRAIFSYFTDEREGNYSWISISDMRNKMFVSDTKEYLTKEAINSCNMPMVAPNTVLLSFKLTVGQVAITTEETSTNEAIAHFNTQDENLREYTYLYLQNFNYNELGNTSAIGNAINSTIVKNMKFVLPDEDLLVKFKGIAGNIVDTILLLTKQNNNLKQQRDLLLPRLMSGKLEVKVKQEV